MLVIGMDPGKSGAIVVLESREPISIVKMDVTPTIGTQIDWEKFAHLVSFKPTSQVHVFLEEVTCYLRFFG